MRRRLRRATSAAAVVTAAATEVAEAAVAMAAAARGVVQAATQALQRGAGEAVGVGWGEKHWQRASSKADAGSKRGWQQAAITAVAITAAARGVALAMV